MKEELLSELAAKLGTTTEYLWGVLVEKQYVDAITTLIGIGIVSILTILASMIPSMAKSWSKSNREAFWFCYIFVVLIVITLSITEGIDAVRSLISPEGSALQELMNAL